MAVPGFGVALKMPPKKVGLGLFVEGILEAGGVIRGKISANASGSSKESLCGDEPECTAVNVSGSIPVSGGVTFTLEGTVLSCGFSNPDSGNCNNLIMLGGAVDVGVAATGGYTVKANLGDSCPVGCQGFYLNETKAFAKLELKIMVGGVYEGAYEVGHDHKLWDKIGDGACK
jgi:hypothetical protein